MRDCYVYIVTNKNHSTLYIGMTNDLRRRVWEHREKLVSGFTAKYSLSLLLYFEVYPERRSSIAREKQLKGWRHEKKIALIEKTNPRWMDLGETLEQPEIVRDPSTPLRSAQDDGGEEQAAGPEYL